MRLASEGHCPLCEAELVIHNGQGCCPCCGDSYRVESNRLEIRRCSIHGKHCIHWQAIWILRDGA